MLLLLSSQGPQRAGVTLLSFFGLANQVSDRLTARVSKGMEEGGGLPAPAGL